MLYHCLANRLIVCEVELAGKIVCANGILNYYAAKFKFKMPKFGLHTFVFIQCCSMWIIILFVLKETTTCTNMAVTACTRYQWQSKLLFSVHDIFSQFEQTTFEQFERQNSKIYFVASSHQVYCLRLSCH